MGRRFARVGFAPGLPLGENQLYDAPGQVLRTASVIAQTGLT